MINNGKTMNRLWAALTSDFEVLLGKFLDSPGWDFEHFGQVARDMQIPLIMNMALGRGKSKDEHYEIIATMILDAAKQFWLRPRNPKLEDFDLDLKRRIGGFFTTYVMYVKQPYKGRTKINMSPKDLTYVRDFINDISALSDHEVIDFMLNFLTLSNAFSFMFFPHECGVESWRRMMLTNQKSELVQASFEMRDIHDPLAYGSDLHKADKEVISYSIAKIDIADRMKRTVLSCHLDPILNHENNPLNMFVSTVGLQKITATSDALAEMTREPILTLEQLTCTDSIDRRILAETRRRIERQRKKILEETPKASNPYVREGGIYGRKKEIDEEKENRERRERGMCSGNLWTYINGLSFDKPLGYLPAEDSKKESRKNETA